MVCVKITKVVLLERKYFKMFKKIIVEFDVNSVLSVGRIHTQMGGILIIKPALLQNFTGRMAAL